MTAWMECVYHWRIKTHGRPWTLLKTKNVPQDFTPGEFSKGGAIWGGGVIFLTPPLWLLVVIVRV